jgi:hypothetical protein
MRSLRYRFWMGVAGAARRTFHWSIDRASRLITWDDVRERSSAEVPHA